MAIQFSDLPTWAKEEVERLGGFGILQIVGPDGHSLQINGPNVIFNGQKVVQDNEDSTEEETMSFGDMPLWAQLEVIRSSEGSQLSLNRNNDSLLINADGSVFFNGTRVITE